MMTCIKKEELFKTMARPEIRGLKPYDASLPDGAEIFVSANENGEGTPAPVIDAMKEALASAARYPESTSLTLRQKLAARYGLASEQIITSNGLDGLFTMLSRAFLSPCDEVIVSECTFGVYAECAEIAGASVVKVPLEIDFSQNPASFADAVTEKTKMLFYCNPNNPTGNLTPAEEIEKMLERVPKHVVILLDEAYLDFSGADMSASFKLLARHPNLIICRTFSKLCALAGMRIGWAAADPALLGYLYRVREPYCVSHIAEAGACAALETPLRETAERITAETAKLCGALREAGYYCVPSSANFVLFFPGERYENLCETFARNKISVRKLNVCGKRAIRISAGSTDENRTVTRLLLQSAAQQ